MSYDEYEEAKATLREANRYRKNKGSRGGQGSWARNHPGETRTRKPSAAEEADQKLRVQALIEEYRIDLDEGQRAENAQFLKEECDFDLAASRTPAALLNVIQNHSNRRMVVNANKKYLKAFVYAYALYEHITSASDWEVTQYITIICEKTGIRCTKGFDLARAVFRYVIDYDDGEEGKGDRRKWSRDVKAMRWLMSQNVRPHEVRDYQAKNGGGVFKWSKGGKPVNPAAKKVEVKVAAEAIEKDFVENSAKKSDFSYYDDDDETTSSESDLLSLDPSLRKLAKLAGGGPWLGPMLQFFDRDKGIALQEVMLTAVYRDPSRPSELVHIGTGSIGCFPNDLQKLEQMFRVWCEIARTFTVAPSSYRERVQWCRSLTSARRAASDRRKKWAKIMKR